MCIWFLYQPTVCTLTGSYALLFHWTRRIDPCTFALWSRTPIYRESKAAAFTETTASITNGTAGQHSPAYSTGHSASHHKKSVILYSARHERVMTFCHESAPSLNSYSHFCTVPEWPLYTGIYQAVLKLHNFFFPIKILPVLVFLQRNIYPHFRSTLNP